MPRSIDQLDFAGLALLSRTYSTFEAPVGVPHYLLIAVLHFEFDSATAIQTAVRAWLVRGARQPTAAVLPNAYLVFVFDRKRAQELERGHYALSTDSDDTWGPSDTFP